MRSSLLVTAALSALSALSAPQRCGAQPSPRPQAPHAPASAPSEAEVRFARGLELFNVRNYEGALAEFQRSYELSGQTGLLYNLGRTYHALGRYPEAARAIEDYLRRATDLTPERRAEVEGMLTQTRSFIARIDVRVEPAEASPTVSLDGDVVTDPQRAEGLAVGPGRHVLEARADGWQTASASLLLASGDRREVRLTLRRAPETRVVEVRAPATATGRLVIASAPSGARARVDGRDVALPAAEVSPGRHSVEVSAPGHAPWIGDVDVAAGATRVITTRLAPSRGLAPRWFIAGAAATGVFLVAGVALGVMTASTHDEYAQRYRDEYALPEVADLRDRGETLRALTNVSFGLAAAAGVATVVLFTQTRWRQSSADIAFSPAPGGGAARLRITF